MAAVSIHPSSHRAIFQIESWLCGNAQAAWFMAFGSALVIQKQDPAVKRRRCEDNNLLPRDRRLSISWDESTTYHFAVGVSPPDLVAPDNSCRGILPPSKCLAAAPSTHLKRLPSSDACGLIFGAAPRTAAEHPKYEPGHACKDDEQQ